MSTDGISRGWTATLSLKRIWVVPSNDPYLSPASCPQPMTDKGWRINTPVSSSLRFGAGGEITLKHVLYCLPEFPS